MRPVAKCTQIMEILGAQFSEPQLLISFYIEVYLRESVSLWSSVLVSIIVFKIHASLLHVFSCLKIAFNTLLHSSISID